MTGIIATLAGILGAVGGVLLWVVRRFGRADAKVDQLEDAERRRKAGENAAAKERKDTDGLSDDDVADRLRKRTDEWRGL